jgi:hypothetical protein
MTLWRYDPPYDVSNADGKPPNNPERFVEVRSEEGETIGFYYFEPRAGWGEIEFIAMELAD